MDHSQISVALLAVASDHRQKMLRGLSDGVGRGGVSTVDELEHEFRLRLEEKGTSTYHIRAMQMLDHFRLQMDAGGPREDCNSFHGGSSFRSKKPHSNTTSDDRANCLRAKAQAAREERQMQKEAESILWRVVQEIYLTLGIHA